MESSGLAITSLGLVFALIHENMLENDDHVTGVSELDIKEG